MKDNTDKYLKAIIKEESSKELIELQTEVKKLNKKIICYYKKK